MIDDDDDLMHTLAILITLFKQMLSFDNYFNMFPQYPIWSRYRQVVAFDDGTSELFFWKGWLFWCRFWWDFIQNIQIDSMILCWIKRLVNSLLKFFELYTRSTIISQCFDSRDLLLLYPIYEIPRSLIVWCDLLNFFTEE